MADDKKWTYEGPASPGDADGEVCFVCDKRIIDDSQPGRWVVKAEEDYADSDFPTEVGYTHYECTQKHNANLRKSRFELPEVPDLPKRN